MIDNRGVPQHRTLIDILLSLASSPTGPVLLRGEGRTWDVLTLISVLPKDAFQLPASVVGADIYCTMEPAQVIYSIDMSRIRPQWGVIRAEE